MVSNIYSKQIIRVSDGYINGTLLCQPSGKQLCNWKKLSSTRALINILCSKLNKLENEVIDVHGKSNKISKYFQGTWIHPDLALNLAQWISPEFSLTVSEWIDEWKKDNNSNQKRYICEIENLTTLVQNKQTEKLIQTRLHTQLGGNIEVEVPTGFIDLLTDSELIEIKTYRKWKHGLGQLLAYSKFEHHSSLRLHLFDIDDSIDKQIIIDTCSNYNISVSFEL